jgi:hypothetical protein
MILSKTNCDIFNNILNLQKVPYDGHYSGQKENDPQKTNNGEKNNAVKSNECLL